MKRFASRLMILAGVTSAALAVPRGLDAAPNVPPPPGATQVWAEKAYVCDTVFYPNAYPVGEGDYGVVYADLYTGVNCSGTYLFRATFCTLGATATSGFAYIACNANELYDEQSVLALNGWLQHALTSQEPIVVTYNAAQGYFWGVVLASP